MRKRPSDLFICIAGLLVAGACASCGDGDRDKVHPVEPAPAEVVSRAPEEVSRKKVPAPFGTRTFPTAGAALQYVLEKSNPLIVGFGEFHQHTTTVKTRSALERFSRELLPVVAGRTSDLVVETWVSTGNCGKAEKQVTEDVDEVSKRPEATENETVRLIKKASALGVSPHVLELGCKDYEALQGDGGVDYLALLELVGKRLGETAKKAVLFRDAKRAESGPKGGDERPTGKKMVAIYGGAVHNDATPVEMWKSVTFGTDLKAFSSNRYVEIDLLVPEFVQTSPTAKQEKWYPLLEAEASVDKTLVIELSETAYIIVFKKGVGNTAR